MFVLSAPTRPAVLVGTGYWYELPDNESYNVARRLFPHQQVNDREFDVARTFLHKAHAHLTPGTLVGVPGAVQSVSAQVETLRRIVVDTHPNPYTTAEV